MVVHAEDRSERRKTLFGLAIPAIDELFRLIPTQSKVTLCTWALGYSECVLVPIWVKRHRHDERPLAALAAAHDWLADSIKLWQVKPLILACHRAARENEHDPTALATARAIGQAASTIHACGHSVGIALYGALAVAYDDIGVDAPWADLEQRAVQECDRILVALQAIAVKDEPNPCRVQAGLGGDAS